MAKRPELAKLVQGLRGVKPQALGPRQVEVKGEGSSAFLADAVPPLTAFEQAQEKAEAEREAKPWAKPGPDPRRPFAPKGEMTVASLASLQQGEGLGKRAYDPSDPQVRIKLNNARAKAKLGQALTLAERKLLGQWDLRRILARLRSQQGE